MSQSRRLDDLPHRFADRTEIAEVRAAHGELAAGDASGERYRLAGRAMGRPGVGPGAGWPKARLAAVMRTAARPVMASARMDVFLERDDFRLVHSLSS